MSSFMKPIISRHLCVKIKVAAVIRTENELIEWFQLIRNKSPVRVLPYGSCKQKPKSISEFSDYIIFWKVTGVAEDQRHSVTISDALVIF